MTFDPTTNRVQLGLLTPNEKDKLQRCKHGWERFQDDKWVSLDDPVWFSSQVYRAKPAPVVKSVWCNIYVGNRGALCLGGESSSLEMLRNHVQTHGRSSIGVARFDLIDGKLSVTLEPLEDKP